MNLLIFKFLESLAKNAASKAAPFAVGEIEALTKFFKAYVSVEFDFTLSPEERSALRQMAVTDLKSFLAACEAEGVQILTDLPGIFLSAGADNLMDAFGFNTASATIASTPLPQ